VDGRFISEGDAPPPQFAREKVVMLGEKRRAGPFSAVRDWQGRDDRRGRRSRNRGGGKAQGNVCQDDEDRRVLVP